MLVLNAYAQGAHSSLWWQRGLSARTAVAPAARAVSRELAVGITERKANPGQPFRCGCQREWPGRGSALFQLQTNLRLEEAIIVILLVHSHDLLDFSPGSQLDRHLSFRDKNVFVCSDFKRHCKLFEVPVRVLSEDSRLSLLSMTTEITYAEVRFKNEQPKSLGNPSGAPAGKASCWFQTRLWFVAVVCIVLISTCFIVSCVVFYEFTYGKTNKRLSQLHTHSSLTCFSEETIETGKTWGCCPTNWKSFGSSCYFISEEFNFWAKSEQICVGMGAHLMVINTKKEQDFIVKHLNETYEYFLGLSDPQGNDNWQWIDKTPYQENFRFWHKNEPNFSGEECGSIVFWKDEGWGWNDVFCFNNLYSICEMNKLYL
ncbi:C-type lectin domain family 6 member A-like [Suncus etruscus]|uniref:C-type lectin domain family 6 member A-like n=1 Tax=Suncus etruscus TaxID=109475 RepID=UPI00210F360A|nr:C-type lectin domain family 6 member A-like [Suncus etruscus]